MAILGFEIEEITKFVQMLEESGLDEIVIKEEGRYLRMRGPRQSRPSASQPPEFAAAPIYPQAQRALPPARQPSKHKPGAEPVVPVMPADQMALESPMMGMFYRSEKPGGPALVNVGQSVSVGQVIGIIEAMKIFSEVLAEHAGIVVAVPAVDGELVHAGAPLVIIRK